MFYWKSTQPEKETIHCLGNGKMAVYEQGPKIIQVFGPPYSSPSFIQLNFLSGKEIEARCEREQGTAIWKHAISINGEYVGEIVDYVDSIVPCMIRKLELVSPVDFLLTVQEDIRIVENGWRFEENGVKEGLLIIAEPGVYIQQCGKYPSPKRLNHQVTGKGDLQFIKCEEKNRWRIHCESGESFIYFIGGPTYPECIENTEDILKISYEESLRRTREWWRDFSGRRHDFEKLIPENVPHRDVLLKAVDSVAVLIKVQQGVEGGVMAEINFPLAYVRDQYGDSRGYLKLGYFSEAKVILNFYWNIWKKHGAIHNAQAIGVDGIFHIHENDEVEITGYLIIQAFEYFGYTEDNEFINEILPMLEWAWEAQKKHLIKHMLPFNGDETYIARGIIPRTVMYDGSAETTLLFIIGGNKLLQWVEQNNVWPSDKLSENYEVFQQCSNNYRLNFYAGNKLSINNPDRRKETQLPRFRHGACEAYKHMATNECFYVGWMERDEEGKYVCPACLSKGENKQEAGAEKFYIQTANLIPMYLDSTLLSKDEILNMIEELLHQIKNTGRYLTRREGNVNWTVGYDYGLLLYNLTELNHPMALEIYEKMLSLLDETGSWCEFYIDDKPFETTITRYRPMESGMNLDAVIHFAMQYKGGENRP